MGSKVTALLLFGLMLCIGCSEETLRPNILFIAVDDLRPELGCYGNSIVHSPNIDQFAKDGFLFKHHYVQVPTCGASRCALLTGMRPRSKAYLSNSVMANKMAGREEMDQPETMIHHLRRNGYYTVGIGKISHSADGMVYGYEETVSDQLELPHSWDERLFDSGKWGTGWNAFFGYADGGNRQGKQKQVKPYEKGMVEDEGYPDGLTTNLALEKLRELKGQSKPFFLGVGLFKPHLPFTAPAKYWDLYDEDAVPLPLVDTLPEGASPASLQKNGEFNQYALGEEKASLDSSMSDGYIRKLKHAYYGCVSYADAQIGRMLDELERQGLAENTIVVIWGDHGWHLGEQRVWGKHTLSEYALRSAFLMRVPELKSEGVEIQRVVESVDIYPTLLELCEVALPVNTLDGSSFVKHMISPDEKGGDAAYSYYRNGFSVRTDSFRLSKYFRAEEPAMELYDYVNDPAESRNVASEHPEIVSRLLPILNQGDYQAYR